MKVFNLRCEHGHPFEGWFKSHLAFEDQRSRGLLECPICESRVVEKTLSAPRLNLALSHGATSEISAEQAVQPADQASAMVTTDPRVAPQLAAALKLVREMLSKSENVGERFADEARAMHANEIPVRAIHGSASLETAQELSEEGIPVLAIPFANLLKTPLQ